MIKRFLLWFFKDMVLSWNAEWFSIHTRFDEVIRVIANAKPPRQRVYVTLRGAYLLDGKEVIYGWTQAVDIPPGISTSVRFSPYSWFRCKQVDVLGPATISDVQVGNLSIVQHPFEAPATVGFDELCDVGNVVTVSLWGIP